MMYAVLVNISSAEDQLLLLAEPYSNSLPRSLNLFNFEKTVRWHDLPKDMEWDIFTSSLSKIEAKKEEKDEEDITIEKLSIDATPFPLCLNGWSGTNDDFIFVFSALNSNRTFIGTVGDAFEDPTFTIMSFEFIIIQDNEGLNRIPIVTILDNELNRRIILAPDFYEDNINAIY